LKIKYFDTAGVRVDSGVINDLLHQLDISEDELIEHLGNKRVFAHGYVLSYLRMMISHDDFYFSRNKETG
jgi:hypothetical protein